MIHYSFLTENKVKVWLTGRRSWFTWYHLLTGN